MLFNSYDFLFLFLPSVLLAYYFLSTSNRNLTLTIASYFFYGYWDFRFCALLLVSTIWDFYIGKKIYESPDQKSKKILLFLSIFLNLSLLGYFKYSNFFVDSLSRLFPVISLETMEIILPVGISFFTFQTMSYSIDLYQGNAKPVKSWVDFACYVSMFPQLVAGPIVRYSQIAGQLIERNHSIIQFSMGIRRFIIGLFKKVVIADHLGIIADQLFFLEYPSFQMAWLGAISFSLQIYFDFSGYSDMAIGLGRLFGFELPENFNFPYQAPSLSGFWRRWHMSLSYWLRDYVYIPLGGSRVSASRANFNLIVTMALCGLWHGANWTFVLWGVYHGFFLMVERFLRGFNLIKYSFFKVFLTYLIVVVGWVLFRANTVGQAWGWIKMMMGFGGANSESISILVAPFAIFSVIAIQVLCWIKMPPMSHFFLKPIFSRDMGLAFLLMVSIVVILGMEVSPFLYFQF